YASDDDCNSMDDDTDDDKDPINEFNSNGEKSYLILKEDDLIQRQQREINEMGPPALPTDRSPENEEIGATFSAGRTCGDQTRMENERTLTDAQRYKCEGMLRALTLERIQIEKAMGFALDNVDAAGEMVCQIGYCKAEPTSLY
ncbi:hypothetical protein Tco_1396245, partial [Tanacetum coccineum]